jgi:hypothetical protein
MGSCRVLEQVGRQDSLARGLLLQGGKEVDLELVLLSSRMALDKVQAVDLDSKLSRTLCNKLEEISSDNRVNLPLTLWEE